MRFALLVSGCATGPRPAATPAAPRPAGSVTGTWTWTQRGVHPATGDLHIQEEVWHLEQTGSSVVGHYDSEVTNISGDGRPYRCNEELSFTRRTRYEVRGSVSGGRLQVEEIEYTADAGPCDDGIRALDQYFGAVDGEAIVLSGATGRQTLRRASAEPGSEPAPDLSGEWLWEHRTVDVDGDRKVEMERWVLEQHDAEISGHYESTVILTAGGERPFHCNQGNQYTTHARFEVVGRIEQGNRLALRETVVQVDPGPCERGQRRLASYRGSIADGAIVLDWGAGRQTLRRAAPGGDPPARPTARYPREDQ